MVGGFLPFSYPLTIDPNEGRPDNHEDAALAEDRSSKERRVSPPSKARGKGRRPGSGPARRERISSERAEELARAGRRARAGKALLAASGACLFAITMVFARHSYAGHAKQPATALGAPPQFVGIVRQNLLQAGVVAPAQAPPGAATAVS